MNQYSAINSHLDVWQRIGRGRSFEFVATDQEILAWLISCLPVDFAPYTLVSTNMVQQGKSFVERTSPDQVDRFLELKGEGKDSVTEFWIWSQSLTPDLELKSHATVTRQLAFNGLIRLSHGRRLTDYTLPERPIAVWPSDLVMVDRVLNSLTGELRHYDDYLRIYRALVRKMKERTVYRSILRFRSGEEREATKTEELNWTEGAKRLYDAGTPFNAIRPGSRLGG